MTTAVPRRELLIESAMRVIAEAGLRGLTHRAVDRDAGLPEGSCSAYFRTRQALLVASATAVTAGLRTDVEALTARLDGLDPASDAAVGLVVAQLRDWLDHPTRPLARLELTVESTRNAEVAAVLKHGRDRLEQVASQALGREVGPASRAVVAALDGLLLGAISMVPAQRVTYLNEGVSVLARVLPRP